MRFYPLYFPIYRQKREVIQMTKQQMKSLIAKACREGLKKRQKIKLLEYEISFGEFVLDVSFSLN